MGREPAARWIRIVAVGLASGAAGCVRTLPPPAAPERTVPRIEESRATPEGHGRVVVDVVDGPMQVLNVDGPAVADPLLGRPACVTPCVLDLRHGRRWLAFDTPGPGFEVDWVEIGNFPVVCSSTTLETRSVSVRESEI